MNDHAADDGRPAPQDVKQVIVIRRDLKMRRGKEIAQGAHASMAWLAALVANGLDLRTGTATLQLDPVALVWLNTSWRKVALQVPGEAELLELQGAALARGLRVHVVTDSWRTEFDGVPTRTALAIGPDLADRIDEVTGHLAIY